MLTNEQYPEHAYIRILMLNQAQSELVIETVDSYRACSRSDPILLHRCLIHFASGLPLRKLETCRMLLLTGLNENSDQALA
jgi:hypothetical protein